MAKVGKEKGLRAGTSFDLQTVWDLSTKDDRQSMWKQPKEEKPSLIVISPPCGPFGQLQELNFGKMDPGKVMRIIQTGLEHL